MTEKDPAAMLDASESSPEQATGQSVSYPAQEEQVLDDHALADRAAGVSIIPAAMSKSVEVTPTGLRFVRDVTYDEWAEIGQSLRYMESGVQC